MGSRSLRLAIAPDAGRPIPALPSLPGQVRQKARAPRRSRGRRPPALTIGDLAVELWELMSELPPTVPMCEPASSRAARRNRVRGGIQAGPTAYQNALYERLATPLAEGMSMARR
jgi:hypothetical protein